MPQELCRVANVVAVLSLILFAAGVGWVGYNIATAEELLWFATPLPFVLTGAAIIAVWLLLVVLPLRWWLEVRRRSQREHRTAH